MAVFKAACLLCLLAIAAEGSHLRSAPKPEGEKAVQLRMKLENIGRGLGKIASDGGDLSKSRIADDIGAFMGEFQDKMDKARDFEKKAQYDQEMPLLEGLQKGVKELSKKITDAQEALHAETVEQEESLLLSVLMQRQDHPLEEQFQIIGDPQFKDLPIAAMLNQFLKNKDATTPVYMQVGKYLDEHRPAGEHVAKAAAEKKETETKKPAEKAAAKKIPGMDALVMDMEKRLLAMMQRLQKKELEQKDQLEKLGAAVKNHAGENKDLAKKFQMLEKAESRKFSKEDALDQQRIATMKKAIAAMKAGDAKALEAAQQEMSDQMAVTKKKNRKFLVLLDFLHKSQVQDCPYCAAQCVEKCHNGEGKSYAVCLGQCKDAGKSKP
eukprot:TRINITY_DN14864_c0_g2_i3.p1 TRINITY_DN14864_c0_g2~~TRINITY_DN14864_c0_g2_i3.p1  ORF type:complete len:381 (-),score=137.91 TRINITY_DN14864_c0_g2_i3:305-1447(-)